MMVDEFIDDIGRRLVMPARRRSRVLEDVRDHLDDAVAQLRSQGIERATAEMRAVKAFGEPSMLAGQFNAHVAGIVFRRAPLTMAACGGAVIIGFVLAAAPLSHQVASRPADLVRQIAFFAAVLGLEFAFVAGARVLVRVAARWNATPSAADQDLIRNAELVFVSGLATAACCWTIAVADAFAAAADASVPLVLAGEVLMIVPSIVACVLTTRRRWPPIADGSVASTAPTRSVFNLAERGLEAAGRQPFLWCGAGAVIGAAAAMSHAETTVMGALVWGVIQAAAVIAGFVLIGPMLQLRGHRSTDAAVG